MNSIQSNAVNEAKLEATGDPWKGGDCGTQRDQEHVAEELIDAAQDAVAEKGLAAVQLRDVAKAAELTPGAVLYYYDDLHDLLQQVYERATQRYSTEREAMVLWGGWPFHRAAWANLATARRRWTR